MMKKTMRMLSLMLLLALLLTACGGAAGGNTTGGKVKDEPYEPVDYQIFPIPEGGYVGDTMPFVTDDGTLELYYLYDTDHNGQGYHPFYMFSTKNLYSYEDHGLALSYGTMADPDPALGTGSVVKDKDGLYHLFYTGHNDNGNGGKGKECVMHATSADRKTWEKHPEYTFFSPDNYSKDDFRDPEVFWVEEEQCYWLLIAGRENTLGGVIARYTSTDLITWEYQGVLYAPRLQYMLECPDLFRIGDKYYITYSWDCVTYYAMSDSMYGPFFAPEDNLFDGAGSFEGSSFIFYAAKTAQMDGKTLLCGWLGRAGLSGDSGVYQWAGNVLNHQIVQHEDGTLGVWAPDSLDEYFTVEKALKPVAIQGGVTVNGSDIALSADDNDYALADFGTRPARMTLECDVNVDLIGCAGFAFGGSESDPTYTALCLDSTRDMLHYEGYEVDEINYYEPTGIARFIFKQGETHHVKLVCENEIVIMYVDGVKALSSRISHSINGAHIGVFANSCNAQFSNITIKIPE